VRVARVQVGAEDVLHEEVVTIMNRGLWAFPPVKEEQPMGEGKINHTKNRSTF
jgi:hypothetical protein